ncbi:MAG: hypothetical protein AB7R40_22465 [Nitrospiraceae bacterium]
MKQKILAAAALALLAGGCYFLPSAPATDAVPVTADVTPARIESTPTAIPATPLPAPTGAATRVQFEIGAYGATLVGVGSNRYLLWAAQGQTFTTHMLGAGHTNLYSVDGRPLYEQGVAGSTVKVQVAASGDHTLQIQATGAYTVGVEIR